ncbi:tetratricopeptide repeat protein [Clostridium sp. CS001]|uniref:tetratricopeptide repeat protein n=1 Tax=Clostridium sp. CS001 TaxID=2880648 RepID=UPI001CF2BEEF|nr:tetratricopeptide repeat protein [Clostridium sp. CS001]MCB2289410.1 tetratricopeptide repeat protein [Clostridium sp. CS001]
MEKMCPCCNGKLLEMNNMLFCSSNSNVCNFKCLINEHNTLILPWNLQKCKQESLWNTKVFTKFPFIISEQYKRVFKLLEQDKRYGVLLQIKDLFEVMIKFPTLLILSKYDTVGKRDKEINKIIEYLLNNNMSLGHWFEIASKCLKINDTSDVMEILSDIVNIEKTEHIVKWRNDTIGHGALQLDDTEDFRNDIEKKLQIIKEHFDRYEERYSNLTFELIKENQIFKLQGVNVDVKIFTNCSKLCFYSEGKEIVLKNYITVRDDGIYFFDSYLKCKKKVKILNYIDAKILIEETPYFEELSKVVSKDLQVNIQNVTYLDNEIYKTSEEELINNIDIPETVQIPLYLQKWLQSNINKDNKGIYLLQMQSGMGKTTFSKMLDQHSICKIKFPEIAVRSYYINDAYSYKVDIFKNNIVDSLKYDDDKVDSIKGNIQDGVHRFFEKDVYNKKEFANVLKFFQNIYKNNCWNNKLLIIIDGLDEIPVQDSGTIFDIIPNIEDLNDGIYILLTCRTSDENSDFVNSKLKELQLSDRLIVRCENKEYIDTMAKFISKISNIENKDKINQIIKLAENKFLYIRLIQYIIKFKGDNFINDGINIFGEFLNLLHNLYSDKYFMEILKILLILASSRKAVTIKEICYLLDGQQINFRFLAYFADISLMLQKERTYRGNAIMVAHSDLRRYLLQNYDILIKDMSRIWVTNVINITIDVLEKDAEKDYLFFHSIYYAMHFNPDLIEKLINSKNFSDHNIYNIIERKNIKHYELERIDEFLTDYIYLIEKFNGSEWISNNVLILLRAYFVKAQIYLENGFGSNLGYNNDLDKAIRIIEDHNIKEIVAANFYNLRSEYFRKIGNITKSMNDNEKLCKLLLQIGVNLDKSSQNKYILSNINLQNAINYKNIDNIDSSLGLSKKALELLPGSEDYDEVEVILKANIYNNMGLCYIKKDNLQKAEYYLSKTIELKEGLNSKELTILNAIPMHYANMGQVLRRKGEYTKAQQKYTEGIQKLLYIEQQGFKVNYNTMAMLYNGRANVFLNLGSIDNDRKCFIDALTNYEVALESINKIDKNNQDIRLLAKLYENIAIIYGEPLGNDSERQKYIDKYNDTIRILAKN